MDLSNFVYTLNELLIEHDLNQSELAEKLGIGSSTISKYLLGQQSPDIDIAVRIADYFNCTLDFLFGLKELNEEKQFHSCPPFSEQFLFLLKKYKISRYKLQKKTEISKSTMYYWQIGLNKPSMDSIIKLAKHFNCSIDFVLGRVDFE